MRSRLCAAETRCAGGGGRMHATGLDVPDRGAEDRSVIDLLRNVVASVARFFAPRAVVVAENLLLRHQLSVLRRSTPRPRLSRLDRWLIATLATRTRSVLEALIACGLRRLSGGIEGHGGCGGATARAVRVGHLVSAPGGAARSRGR